MLQAVTDMFLLKSIRHLGSIPKEIEIFSYCLSASCTVCARTKGIVIEVVAGLLEMVAEAIVGIIEINTRRWLAQVSIFSVAAYISWSSSRNACSLRAFATSLKGLLCSKIPLLPPPGLSLGREVSKPKNDIVPWEHDGGRVLLILCESLAVYILSTPPQRCPRVIEW